MGGEGGGGALQGMVQTGCAVQGFADDNEEESNFGGLSSQNEALKSALEDSRRELQNMAAQVCCVADPV